MPCRVDVRDGTLKRVLAVARRIKVVKTSLLPPTRKFLLFEAKKCHHINDDEAGCVIFCDISTILDNLFGWFLALMLNSCHCNMYRVRPVTMSHMTLFEKAREGGKTV